MQFLLIVLFMSIKLNTIITTVKIAIPLARLILLGTSSSLNFLYVLPFHSGTKLNFPTGPSFSIDNIQVVGAANIT